MRQQGQEASRASWLYMLTREMRQSQDEENVWTWEADRPRGRVKWAEGGDCLRVCVFICMCVLLCMPVYTYVLYLCMCAHTPMCTRVYYVHAHI